MDDLLRCGICCEYFQTALILPKCSHNFCSLCIRRYMRYQTQESCPTCHKTYFESELRPNRILDELIAAFLPLKDKLDVKNKQSSHDDSNEIESGDAKQEKEASFHLASIETGNDEHALNAANKSSSPPKFDDYQKPSSSKQDVIAMDISGDTSDKNVTGTDKNLLPCPVCNRMISFKVMNVHLDHCLNVSEKPQLLPSIKKPQPLPLAETKRKTLPKLVYNLMKEIEIRKRLKDIGLSVTGNRQELIKRHREYTLLYNSDCDSLNPRSASELIKEVEKGEKNIQPTSSSSSSNSIFQITRKSSQKQIIAAQNSYLTANNKQFDNLITGLRDRMKSAKMSTDVTPSTSKLSDDPRNEDTESDSETKPAVSLPDNDSTHLEIFAECSKEMMNNDGGQIETVNNSMKDIAESEDHIAIDCDLNEKSLTSVVDPPQESMISEPAWHDEDQASSDHVCDDGTNYMALSSPISENSVPVCSPVLDSMFHKKKQRGRPRRKRKVFFEEVEEEDDEDFVLPDSPINKRPRRSLRHKLKM